MRQRVLVLKLAVGGMSRRPHAAPAESRLDFALRTGASYRKSIEAFPDDTLPYTALPGNAVVPTTIVASARGRLVLSGNIKTVQDWLAKLYNLHDGYRSIGDPPYNKMMADLNNELHIFELHLSNDEYFKGGTLVDPSEEEFPASWTMGRKNNTLVHWNKTRAYIDSLTTNWSEFIRDSARTALETMDKVANNSRFNLEGIKYVFAPASPWAFFCDDDVFGPTPPSMEAGHDFEGGRPKEPTVGFISQP